MKINGFVICGSINTWGDNTKPKWYVHEYTFSKSVTGAWIVFMSIHPDHHEWDRHQTDWINRGYCVKEATLEVKI